MKKVADEQREMVVFQFKVGRYEGYFHLDEAYMRLDNPLIFSSI